MSGILKGYKLLAWNMTSAAIFHFDVQYKVNEWVTPKPRCGPLCVFDTLEHLQEFIDDVDAPRLIWECEYIPSKRVSVWHPSPTNCKNRILLLDLPCGTKLATKVKLTRMII